MGRATKKVLIGTLDEGEPSRVELMTHSSDKGPPKPDTDEFPGHENMSSSEQL